MDNQSSKPNLEVIKSDKTTSTQDSIFEKLCVETEKINSHFIELFKCFENLKSVEKISDNLDVDEKISNFVSEVHCVVNNMINQYGSFKLIYGKINLYNFIPPKDKVKELNKDLSEIVKEIEDTFSLVTKSVLEHIQLDPSKINSKATDLMKSETYICLLKIFDNFSLELTKIRLSRELELYDEAIKSTIKDLESARKELNQVKDEASEYAQKSLINTFSIISLFSTIGITSVAIFNQFPAIVTAFSNMSLYRAILILEFSLLAIFTILFSMAWCIFKIIYQRSLSFGTKIAPTIIGVFLISLIAITILCSKEIINRDDFVKCEIQKTTQVENQNK